MTTRYRCPNDECLCDDIETSAVDDGIIAQSITFDPNDLPAHFPTVCNNCGHEGPLSEFTYQK